MTLNDDNQYQFMTSQSLSSASFLNGTGFSHRLDPKGSALLEDILQHGRSQDSAPANTNTLDKQLVASPRMMPP